jgi:pimeloyl-ACP methyl ester carboxylesterase
MSTFEVSVNIDGRRLYGLLAGEGEPVVVLDAGLGDTSETWSKIQPAIASFTSVLSYDRSGLGRSDRPPVPRTCKDIVGDLRNLLSTARLCPPYVLVAHSWSGLNARWHASQYPNEIAGMVLIDAVHEDKYVRFAKVLPEAGSNRMWAYVRDPAQNDENIDRITSLEQVRKANCRFDFPVIILTRNAADSTSSSPPDELDVIERGSQREFLKLSPQSRQYISKYTDHYIQRSEPELVIGAIRQIVETAKSSFIPSSTTTPA